METTGFIFTYRAPDMAKLTKTIIVAGLRDEQHHMEVRRRIEERFEVREAYTIQNNHKVLCVIFYDERRAKEAIGYLREKEGLVSHHIISKYEIPRDGERCDETKNQSTLLLVFKNVTSGIDDKELMERMSSFGEVKEIRPVKSFQKCVEFYDSRSAVAAFHGTNEWSYREGTVQARWVWDLSIKTRWEMIKLTDSILKECKLEIKPGKREGEDLREEAKRKKTSETSKNMFLQRFDAFIASNIDLINEDYIG